MTHSLTADLVVDAGGFSVESHLTLERGVLVLFGPSGAGKSLTLQALAGLVRPSSGRIAIGGETIFDSSQRIDVPTHARRIGWVPQHHSLFPHLDVTGNVAFGLPRAERSESNPHVRALLEGLGLSRLAHARTSSLSGGERQRVSLARALAVRPRLLLLDEPFASIDADGRVELRAMLRETLERHGTPAVIVTHDREDAVALGDRLVRFRRGATAEDGLPAEILALARTAP